MKSHNFYWNEIVAFLITLFVIIVIATVAWLLVPVTLIPFHELTQELLIADTRVIAPKVNEQVAFIVSVLSVPAVLWFAIALTYRLPAAKPSTAAWVWTLLGSIAIVFSIPSDPYRFNLIAPVAYLSWGAWVLSLAAIVFIASKQRFWSLDETKTRHLVFIVTVLMLIVVGYPTKIITEYDIPVEEVHLSAFYYSISQSYYGATCLIDFVPQYGCYGEFMPVILWPFGVSPISVTAASTTLSILSSVAILAFAATIIRSLLGFTAFAVWLIILTNGVFWQSANPEPYFQYWPLRTLFPTLALLAAIWWTKSQSSPRAFALGLLSGLAIWWNLDTGGIVCLALAGLIAVSGIAANGLSFSFIRTKIRYLPFYFLAIVLSSLSFLCLLSIKSGNLAFPTHYLEYQKTFAVMGFNMLPLPSPPDAWLVSLALAVAVLTVFGVAIRSRRHSPQLELAAFCAVMGIGLFTYYGGRSHPIVFMLVSWPFLILFFYLLEQWQQRIAPSVWLAFIPRSLILLALVAGTASLAYSSPAAKAKIVTYLTRDVSLLPEPQIRADANYIASLAKPDRTLGILSNSQGFIASALKRRIDLRGVGIQEIIRRVDAEALIKSIEVSGPDDLFIEARLLNGDKQTWGSLPWVADALPRIARYYDRLGTSPDQNMVYFKRTRFSAPYSQ